MLVNNQKIVYYDTIYYQGKPIWSGTFLQSPYRDDLPLHPTEDQVVDYVTGRILNGTYKLAPDTYVNNNAIVYNIGGVKHIIQ